MNSRSSTDPSEFSLLLCPVCFHAYSLRTLQEHIACCHLPHRCMQIAHCTSSGGRCKGKEIFTPSFLTNHMRGSDKDRCKLIYRTTNCIHTAETHTLFDRLMNKSVIELGPVDSIGHSADATRQKLINKLKVEKPYQEYVQAKLKIQEACFVQEHRARSRLSPGYGGNRSLGYNDVRSPGYDRSPGYNDGGRSPGFGGRSPGYSGRSPGYGDARSRSPGFSGGRSPRYDAGRSPGYAEGGGGRSPGYGGGGRSPGYGRRGRSPGYDGGGRSPGYGASGRSPAYQDRSEATFDDLSTTFNPDALLGSYKEKEKSTKTEPQLRTVKQEPRDDLFSSSGTASNATPTTSNASRKRPPSPMSSMSSVPIKVVNQTPTGYATRFSQPTQPVRPTGNGMSSNTANPSSSYTHLPPNNHQNGTTRSAVPPPRIPHNQATPSSSAQPAPNGIASSSSHNHRPPPPPPPPSFPNQAQWMPPNERGPGYGQPPPMHYGGYPGSYLPAPGIPMPGMGMNWPQGNGDGGPMPFHNGQSGYVQPMIHPNPYQNRPGGPPPTSYGAGQAQSQIPNTGPSRPDQRSSGGRR